MNKRLVLSSCKNKAKYSDQNSVNVNCAIIFLRSHTTNMFYIFPTQALILSSGLTSFSHSLTLKFNSNQSNPYLINNHHFDNKMIAEIRSYVRWQ